MSFKCSLFGHSYGETEVVRDRVEDGSEVIITIRELETCQRCGEERVVSENKEVTTLETAADIVADDLTDEPEPASEPGPGAGHEPAGQSAHGGEQPTGQDVGHGTSHGSEGRTGQDVATESGADEGASAGHAPASGGDGTSPSVAETEGLSDAEILDGHDDDETQTDSEGDESPAIQDAETGEVVKETEARQRSGSHESPAAEDDDGVILGDEPTGSERRVRQPGEWPEEPGADDDDDGFEQPLKADSPGDSLLEDGPDVQETGIAVSAPDGVYYCPECEFSVAVEESSHRAGDFCPSCHRGSLEQHVDE